MSNRKRFLTAIGINFFVGLLFTLSCEGEGCMIILLIAIYLAAACISYLPYLFLRRHKTIAEVKVFRFLLPSVLMFVIIAATLEIGSNLPTNPRNLLSIVAVILPNTILQLILLAIERKAITNTIEARGNDSDIGY